MSVPGIVESALEGEEIAARVSLGSEDELYVTPTRTIIYRAEGLLSDESIEEYGHDADRLRLSEGRRKTRFSLEYALDGTEEFTLPSKHAHEAIHPILAGMLNASGVTESGEAVLHSYRFSELTLVITSDRVVKHIGEAVWDDEYEEYPFADLTGISFENGEHATQFVLNVAGRKERIKVPNDEAPRVREHLKQALFEYFDVRSMDELTAHIEPDDVDEPDDDGGGNVDFGEGVDPLEANPPSSGMDSATEQLTDDRFDDTGDRTDDGPQAGNGPTEADSTATADETPPTETESTTSTRSETDTRSDRRSAGGQDQPREREPTAAESNDRNAAASEEPAVAEPTIDEGAGDSSSDPGELEAAGFEPAGDDPDLESELQELRAAVEKQNKLLARQQQTIEQLIEELRRGR